MLLVVFVVGVVVGGGVMMWRQAEPEATPPPRHEHAVELVLFREAPAPGEPGRTSRAGPLYVDSALLLSGLVTSTIESISASGRGLDVMAPDLPVTVSPTRRLRELRLEVRVSDCRSATSWSPRDRSFLISWRDELDTTHMDRAGDLDPSMARTLTDYVAAVCDRRAG